MGFWSSVLLLFSVFQKCWFEWGSKEMSQCPYPQPQLHVSLVNADFLGSSRLTYVEYRASRSRNSINRSRQLDVFYLSGGDFLAIDVFYSRFEHICARENIFSLILHSICVFPCYVFRLRFSHSSLSLPRYLSSKMPLKLNFYQLNAVNVAIFPVEPR